MLRAEPVAAAGLPAAVRRRARRVVPPKTLPPVHPNEGLAALYRRKLDAMIDEMHGSLLYFIGAAYKKRPPELAQDDAIIGMSPAMAMRAVMRKLARRWQRKFDRGADDLAAWFAQTAIDRSDRQLQQILRTAGFSVKFRLSRTANDVLQATTGENVALIRSIASEYLAEVEGLVMRSVSTGRDLGTLAGQLEARYGVTKRRAALISRDQNQKATATITRVRQQSLGIKQAVWVHSRAGAKPRPSHVKAGADKVVYDIAEGWLDPAIGKRIWPGTEINCRCQSRPLIPGF